MPKLAKVSLSLPFGLGHAEWEPDDTQCRAAWELYVELVTRVAVEPIASDQGLLREAMTSLYSLFATTRDVLRKAGPSVGISSHSVGGLAIAVLNKGLRPFLTYWHPTLSNWEALREPTTSPKQHEDKWERADELRAVLEKLRSELKIYADSLAEVANVREEAGR